MKGRTLSALFVVTIALAFGLGSWAAAGEVEAPAGVPAAEAGATVPALDPSPAVCKDAYRAPAPVEAAAPPAELTELSDDACIGCPGRPGCCWNQATDCCYGSSHRCNVCW